VRVLLLPLWGIGKHIIDRSNTEFKQSVVGKTSLQEGIFLGKKKWRCRTVLPSLKRRFISREHQPGKELLLLSETTSDGAVGCYS
jgi:hypothetical protein